MRTRTVKWSVWLLLGWIGLSVLSGCATASPVPGVPQDAATAVPTSTDTTAATATMASTATTAATAVPTKTFTAVPTAAPTSTPAPAPTATLTTAAAEPACAPVPTEKASSGGELALYTVVGLEGEERLEMYACPSADSPGIRQLAPYSAGLWRAGEDREAGGLLWTPVSNGEVAGWVQAGHLARQYGEADPAVAARAGQIVRALREQDWALIAGAVHPDKGVRFSPYGYVRVGEGEGADLAFSAQELSGLSAETTIYRWGTFDGSGAPIEMTFFAYYARFIYDADFYWAYAVGYNETVGAGNTINNVAEVYPQAQVVEFHLPGRDPRFGGMDWRSLRLVLEPVGDEWFLVGIVHDEWTI